MRFFCIMKDVHTGVLHWTSLKNGYRKSFRCFWKILSFLYENLPILSTLFLTFLFQVFRQKIVSVLWTHWHCAENDRLLDAFDSVVVMTFSCFSIDKYSRNFILRKPNILHSKFWKGGWKYSSWAIKISSTFNNLLLKKYVFYCCCCCCMLKPFQIAAFNLILRKSDFMWEFLH